MIVSVESAYVVVLVAGGLMPDVLSLLIVVLRLVIVIGFLKLLDFFVDVADQLVPLFFNLLFVDASAEGDSLSHILARGLTGWRQLRRSFLQRGLIGEVQIQKSLC